jgi:hypothetical protein
VDGRYEIGVRMWRLGLLAPQGDPSRGRPAESIETVVTMRVRLLTSNKSFGEWGQVFGDEVLATAILDRRQRRTVLPAAGSRRSAGVVLRQHTRTCRGTAR